MKENKGRDSIITLKMLYKVRILGETQASVAEEMGFHRNTVSRVCKHYSELTDEYISQMFEKLSVGRISKEDCDIEFSLHLKCKLLTLDMKAIEECCRMHLNCCLSKEDLARNMCKRRGVSFELVQNYDPDRINESHYSRYHTKAELIADIHEIRRYKHAKKNYQEVYYGYYVYTDRYAENPISYQTFYKYAKKFWKDEKWEHTLGEYIDTKK